MLNTREKTRLTFYAMIIGILIMAPSFTADRNHSNHPKSKEVNLLNYYFIDADAAKTFTIYDSCRINLGTITTASLDRITYQSNTQTSTTISVDGSGGSFTFTKGLNYWLKPSGCSSGSYILKVKFKTGIQTVGDTFILTSCSWSVAAGGAPPVIDSYSFVSTLPTPC
jgi:type 1 fimbria pilin